MKIWIKKSLLILLSFFVCENVVFAGENSIPDNLLELESYSTKSMQSIAFPKNNDINLPPNLSQGDITKETSQNQNVNFGPYMIKLKDTIKQNWTPAKIINNGLTIAQFKVMRDGSISDISIYKSSGDSQFDSEALAAIKAVEKFDPLPAEYIGDHIDIQYTFDMHMNYPPNVESFRLFKVPDSRELTNSLNGYIADLNREFRNKLYLKGNREDLVIMQLKIAKDGSLISYNITRSSFNPAFDRVTVNALKSLFPYKSVQ